MPFLFTDVSVCGRAQLLTGAMSGIKAVFSTLQLNPDTKCPQAASSVVQQLKVALSLLSRKEVLVQIKETDADTPQVVKSVQKVMTLTRLLFKFSF